MKPARSPQVQHTINKFNSNIHARLSSVRLGDSCVPHSPFLFSKSIDAFFIHSSRCLNRNPPNYELLCSWASATSRPDVNAKRSGRSTTERHGRYVRPSFFSLYMHIYSAQQQCAVSPMSRITRRIWTQQTIFKLQVHHYSNKK